MDKKILWYAGNGEYLEGDEAYRHVAQLHDELDGLKGAITAGLVKILEYMDECELYDGHDYEALYNNVMNIGETCSNAGIMLELLLEEIEERMNMDE